MIKKEYIPGDTVWIHGVSSSNKLTKGKVIAMLDLSAEGHTDLQYIIEIPTHIEPLLEIRSWHTISQDDQGPVGSMRDLRGMIPTVKKMKTIGFAYSSNNTESFEYEPTPDEIHAALEKSKLSVVHQPLNIKENKPRKRYYKRKKQ